MTSFFYVQRTANEARGMGAGARSYEETGGWEGIWI